LLYVRRRESNLIQLIYRAEFFREGDVYVGLCPELNVSSFGNDIEDAKHSLQEAVEAFIETCEEMGTLKEILEEAGFSNKHDIWSAREPIIEERLAISR
jgi:predicted RNase H-like HicB family nuclease